MCKDNILMRTSRIRTIFYYITDDSASLFYLALDENVESFVRTRHSERYDRHRPAVFSCRVVAACHVAIFVRLQYFAVVKQLRASACSFVPEQYDGFFGRIYQPEIFLDDFAPEHAAQPQCVRTSVYEYRIGNRDAFASIPLFGGRCAAACENRNRGKDNGDCSRQPSHGFRADLCPFY